MNISEKWCIRRVVPLVLVIASLLRTGFCQYDITCFAQNAEPGVCINIKECRSALEILKRKIPDEVQGVINSKCGDLDAKPPNICCPTKSNPHILVNRLAPSELSEHRNFGKINPKNCGAVTQQKIVGGNKTVILEFPWMALISYRTGNQLEFKCAGTLISERYVLTAGHCISGVQSGTSLVGVRLGEHNINTSPDCLRIPTQTGFYEKCAPKHQDVGIEKVIPHPDYTRANYWTSDIGLIKIRKPADFTRINIARICLPIGRTAEFTTNVATVTGWGTTETGETSDELLKAQLKVMDYPDCLQQYPHVTPRHICAAGSPGVDSCDGDSGGPLMTVENVNNIPSYVQYGIVSIGTPFCGILPKPGVYTKVASFMTWILDNIN